MKLTWIGHACFKIESNGYVCIIDPYADGSVPGLTPLREKAHLVLCSHEHGDHAGRETVTLLPEEGSPFCVETIQSFHDDAEGTLRGPNKLFLLSDGTHRIAHLGDMGCGLTGEQTEKFQNLDVLLIPVGGFFTIGGAQAAEIAKALNPRIVIPMHFRDDEKGFGYDKISTVSDFAQGMNSALTLSASEIEVGDHFDHQVLILQPRNL